MRVVWRSDADPLGAPRARRASRPAAPAARAIAPALDPARLRHGFVVAAAFPQVRRARGDRRGGQRRVCASKSLRAAARAGASIVRQSDEVPRTEGGETRA